MGREPSRTVRLSASVSDEQAVAIDKFQAAEGLATRSDAVRLLLEIALDSVHSSGKRFWDRAPASSEQ